MNNWLVVSTPLKNMKVNGKDYPIYYGKEKNCLKPPSSICTIMAMAVITGYESMTLWIPLGCFNTYNW